MEQFSQALTSLLSPWPMLLMAGGTTVGILVGAIPGLTGAMAIALTLPLTFGMSNPNDALALLIGMYVGSISGGLITATLLRIPGTPASVMTTLDGYPLAQKGQPARALGLGIAASFAGGMISWVFLVLLTRPMAELSVWLGPFEYFSLVMTALVLIASVAGRSLTAGILSGFLGMLATIPGTSPATGAVRWTFGMAELNDGFKLLPVLIGLFAVNQVLADANDAEQASATVPVRYHGLFLTIRDWSRHSWNMIRSGLLGTWIGILPGIGANIASAMAYSVARGVSKTPEEFGHGAEEGIVASEAANNATVGGALIPLVALGIPGSVIDAVLLGALMIHGLQPGPLLFSTNPDSVWTIILTMALANSYMLVFMLLAAPLLASVTRIRRMYLIPVLLVLCVIGSYALNNRFFDVWVMLAFGVLGYVLERFEVPLAPFVIGFVLAPIAEENLARGLMLSDGSYLPFVTRPISAVFLLIAIVVLLRSMCGWKRNRYTRSEG